MSLSQKPSLLLYNYTSESSHFFVYNGMLEPTFQVGSSASFGCYKKRILKLYKKIFRKPQGMIIGEDGYRSKILRKYHLLQVFILVVLCCLILAVSFINRNRFMNEHEEKNSVTLRYHSMVPSSHPSISFSVRNLFGKKRLNSIMHSSTMEQARLSNENLFAQNSDNNVTYCVTQETPVKWDALQFFKFGVAVVLVGLSGLFSGLTLGLLGLDKTTLDVSTILKGKIFFSFININFTDRY